jgi:hypothetical protein
MAAGLGFKEFTTGDVLTAADANGYLASQVVMVFADAADRTADLTSPEEGMISYLKDTNAVEKYDGSAWVAIGGAAPASGLTLVKAQTIGSAVSSVTVNDAFSATYDNYLINVSGGVASADSNLELTIGAASSGYIYNSLYMLYSGTAITGENSTGNSKFPRVGRASTDSIDSEVTLKNPFNTKRTTVQWRTSTATGGQIWAVGGGFLDNNTSYTAFTLTPASGTLTGGTIRVYGYQNS